MYVQPHQNPTVGDKISYSFSNRLVLLNMLIVKPRTTKNRKHEKTKSHPSFPDNKKNLFQLLDKEVVLNK